MVETEIETIHTLKYSVEDIYIRGVQKKSKVRYELSDKLIPFLWGILRSTKNFKFLVRREVLPLESQRKF